MAKFKLTKTQRKAIRASRKPIDHIKEEKINNGAVKLLGFTMSPRLEPLVEFTSNSISFIYNKFTEEYHADREWTKDRKKLCLRYLRKGKGGGVPLPYKGFLQDLQEATNIVRYA